MMSKKDIVDYIHSLGRVEDEINPDRQVILFRSNNILIAVLELKSPLRLSLRSEPGLSEVLRNSYETVMPGVNLNSKEWNTIVLTGQVGDEELKSLIRHSFQFSETDI